MSMLKFDQTNKIPAFFDKPLYHPNLTRLLTLAEENFQLLRYLLPTDKDQTIIYCVVDQQFELTILEETNYTLLVSLSWETLFVQRKAEHQNEQEAEVNFAQVPSKHSQTNLFIRVYFDAKLAEVVAKNRSVYRGRYGYPNKELLQVDEKERSNRFLYEWLKACLLCMDGCFKGR